MSTTKGSTGHQSKTAKPKVESYIDARKKLPIDQLVVKGKLGNAYRYPHPNALKMFDLASDKAIANAERVEKVNPIAVFPDHNSGDFDYLNFLDLLSVKATKKFGRSVDPDTGYCYGNGVRGNFYGARHVAGLPMTPATYTLITNKYRREAIGLAEKPIKDWHRNIMLAWWINALEGITPVDLAVPAGTSSCSPEFTSKVDRKMEIAREALRDAPKAGALMLQGDFVTPWEEYKIGGAVYVVYRLQVTDKVTYNEKTKTYHPKGREIAPLIYALSGGLDGHLVEADKFRYVNELFDERGYHLKGFFACRKRTAAGAPGKLNFAIGPIADAMRENIYRKYPRTYHDRTREQKTKDLREWDSVIMADVSDHDLLWGKYNLDLMVEAFKIMGFADWWIALFYRAMTLPQYISSLSVDDGSTLIGEWDDFNDLSMLLSGIKFTDICGTGGMTPVYIITQIEHAAQHHIESCRTLKGAVHWVDRYLKWQLDIAQKSKSDDAAMLFRTARVTAKAHRLQQLMVKADKKEELRLQISPYMIVGYEPGGAYLGDLLYFDHTLDLKSAIFIGNIMSFVHNKFGPEYSCPPRGTPLNQYGAYRRKFPGLAWESATEVYGDCPIFGEMLELIELCWAQTIGGSFLAYMNKLLEEDRVNVVKYSEMLAKEQGLEIDKFSALDMTAIDREVLSDTSKIHYKYKLEMVSPFLHHLLVNAIPAREITPYFNLIVKPKEKQCDLVTLRKLLNPKH